MKNFDYEILQRLDKDTEEEWGHILFPEQYKKEK